MWSTIYTQTLLPPQICEIKLFNFPIKTFGTLTYSISAGGSKVGQNLVQGGGKYSWN